jgi:hypothetical protein
VDLDLRVYNMAYYNDDELQPVHAADAWNLDRYLFTAVAYLARAGKKKESSYNEDVLKALWFLAYALTKNSKYAETVVHVCKGLMHEDKETEGGQLPVHVCTTHDTGDVGQHSINGIQEEPKLVRERSDNVLRQPFTDRINNWLKGAIE